MGNYILAPNGEFMSADELYHYGIKGMKWGVRRYQNKDGSLTPAGKKRLVKNITSKKTSTIEADEYAKEAIDNVRGFMKFKNSEVYRHAKRNADDYRGYKEAYWKAHDKVYWDSIDSVEKKYGKYEDLERNGNVTTMEKFNSDLKKAMDAAYKKHDLYAVEEALVRKYERVLHDRFEVEKLGGRVVEDILGIYGDKPLRGAGSAIWGYGRVVDRVKVKNVVNHALTDDITKNVSRPFSGWEAYRYDNKTRDQQWKNLNSEFKARIRKGEREGKTGGYLDLLQDQWALAGDEYDRGELYPRTIREHIDLVDESWEWITRDR